MTLNEEQMDLLQEMREAGWAVTVVSPDVLDGTPKGWVENVMRDAAMREIGWFDGEDE